MNTQTIVKAPNAIDVLIAHHRKINMLFTDYFELGESDGRLKEKFVQFLCRDLLKYMNIKEQFFHPAIVGDIKRGQDWVDEANIAHVGFKELIAKLQNMNSDHELYDAMVEVLFERFEVYVDEIETCIFPLLERSKVDLDELGESLRQGAEKVG